MAQPPPGYPNKSYPQQNYYQAPPPAQPGHHQTVFVHQPQPVIIQTGYSQPSTATRAAGFLGGVIGSAVRSGSQLVGDVVKETSREIDRLAVSPLLDCFNAGCVVQLRNKSSAGCVRVQQNGLVDSFGTLGNDYSAHFFVVSRYENKVVLRSAANPAFHLAMANGMVTGTGVGDQASTFRLHETFNHYLTLQHAMSGNLFGIDKQGKVMPPAYLNNSKDECKFEVHLVYSPFGHRYAPTH